jgi:tRNA(Ile)-lysidine synthase
MRCEAHDPSDATLAALEALIDWLGGAVRPLDRRGKATLARFIASAAKGGEGAATSLGRVLIRRLKGDLVLRRENRDIGKLVLESQESGIWDRRFQIRNLSRSAALEVAGGGEHGIMPCFGHDKGASQRILTAEEGVVGGYICQALAGRASRILPLYQTLIPRKSMNPNFRNFALWAIIALLDRTFFMRQMHSQAARAAAADGLFRASPVSTGEAADGEVDSSAR